VITGVPIVALYLARKLPENIENASPNYPYSIRPFSLSFLNALPYHPRGAPGAADSKAFHIRKV